MADSSRIVRMTKRRPPLLPHLQKSVAEKAEEAAKEERRKGRELKQVLARCSLDFDAFRKSFRAMHEDSVHRGLNAVFKGVSLTPTPLSGDIKARFMKAYAETGAEIRPAFHGTDAANYDSIFQRGLLVPGVGNSLRIAHGAAHGYGVYTANVDSAWLSKGFCRQQSMLVCAVIHNNEVRHHGDAMVVGRADLVVPIFLAAEEAGIGQYVPTKKQPRAVAASPSPSGTVSQQVAKVKVESKSSKFKARLAAKSGRH